ncbi:jg18438 [Pararge aegeria aegeria]|uniref:Jg18438 protein n=2 Tax=Pararge aegeria TaxID=116150 RepID=A0A8S4SBI0_9NEOP|nr:jg18438 [Pararge aegeria aegeria]
MVQAIHSVNINTGWARAFSCNNKRAVHYILQIIGSILGITGCLRMILTKGPHQNFSNFHSIFGYIAMIFTILSLIGGVVNLYSTKISINNKFIRIAHAILGSLTIVFAFLSMASFPITEEISKKKHLGNTNHNLFIALTIISLILILASPIMNVRRMLA